MIPAHKSGAASQVGEVVGHAIGEPGRRRDLGRKPAVGCPAGEISRSAQILAPAATETAGAAGAVQPGHAHPLPEAKLGHARAQLGHPGPPPGALESPDCAGPGKSPSTTCKSVRQIAQVETAMRTSSAARTGEGISRKCSGWVVTGAGADRTQACMAKTEGILPPGVPSAPMCARSHGNVGSRCIRSTPTRKWRRLFSAIAERRHGSCHRRFDYD